MTTDNKDDEIQRSRSMIESVINQIEDIKIECVTQQLYETAHHLREAILSLRNQSRDLLHSTSTTVKTTDSKEVAR